MKRLPLIATALMAVSLLLPIGHEGEAVAYWPGASAALLCALVAIGAASALMPWRHISMMPALAVAGVLIGAIAPLLILWSGRSLGLGAPGLWVFVIGLGLLAWQAMEGLSRAAQAGLPGIAAPLLFGAWLLYLWEVIVVGFGIPQILLPAPHQIFGQIVSQADVLWGDFRQTFLKAVLAGWVAGCALGFAVAVTIDRVPFLQRGLMPLGSLISAVPIVGIAPIMVMWFGFDWQSKAAVIVVMTFFPMLINTTVGLNQTEAMALDLMRSYGASYWQTFLKVRLPSALPFIFNALKINSTLALIGAIVAEFFGSPIAGMGFRISVEVARMNVDVVWATIAVAALSGSAFYGLLALLERGFTFWHPSYRS
jgi:NitT/TauT family transport system permease protein